MMQDRRPLSFTCWIDDRFSYCHDLEWYASSVAGLMLQSTTPEAGVRVWAVFSSMQVRLP